jgi:hypothetical protein
MNKSAIKDQFAAVEITDADFNRTTSSLNSHPQDRYKRFQIAVSSFFSGFYPGAREVSSRSSL